MPSKTKKFINKTLKPMMGGALLENLAGESASGEHYTKKLNFRRHQEGEARREGWDVFQPSGKFLEAFPQIQDSLPSNKYRLTARYDNNTIFGETKLGLKYGYSARFGFVPREYPNENLVNYNRISPDAPIYLGSDESSTLSVDSNGQLEITDEQYNALPATTYGSSILQDNAGLFYWQKLHLGKDVFEPVRSPIRLICQFRSGDGKSCLIVIAGGTIFKYEYIRNPEYINKIPPPEWADGTYFVDGYIEEPPSDYKWVVIGSGYHHVDETVGDYFANEPINWEAAVVNSTLYLNNGKDLPIAYRQEYNEVIPLLELRENPAYRVAAVGTITEFNGFLMVADIQQISVNDWQDWMKGDDPYGVVLDSPPYNRNEVKVTRSPYSIIWSYEGDGMRYGTAVYGTMAQNSNEFIAKYPLRTAYDEGVSDIYGEFGHPAVTFPVGEEVVIVGAGQEIAEINGVEINGVLQAVGEGVTFSRISIGEVVNNSDGTQTYRIVDRNGNAISAPGSIVEEELANPIVNSTTGYMIRLDSVGTKTSVVDLVDDGSRILKMKTLVDRLMIYRDSGYMTAIKVNTGEVFQFERRYTGPRVVDFRNTLIDVAGRFHVFMSFNGIYQVDRAASQPKLLQPMEKGTRFWEDLSGDDAERVFTIDNSETREVFFCTPTNTFAFDYENSTVSEIDQVFTAGSGIIRPYTSKKVEHRWILLAISDSANNISLLDDNSEDIYNFIVRYGKGPDGYQIYNRYGNEYRSILQSGLIDFTDQFNDKDIRAYALHVAENTLQGLSSSAQVKIRISVVPTTQATVDDITEVELDENGEFEFTSGERIEAETILVDPQSENMIPLYLRGPYFRDAIIVEGKDNPVKLIGRTFEVSGVDSRLSQVVTNQG